MNPSIRLTESFQRLAGSLLCIVQTRLELLGNELEEERLHIEQTLFYKGIALLFFGLSIMLITVLIVVLFWDSQRLLVLGGLAGLYFISGLLVWNTSSNLIRKKSRLFSASLAELSSDRDQLTP
jgi:uncharacterized membrane protein YqjE